MSSLAHEASCGLRGARQRRGTLTPVRVKRGDLERGGEGAPPLAFLRRGPQARPAPDAAEAGAPSTHGHREGALVLLPIAILTGITVLLGADLISDYRAGLGPSHLVLEIGAGVLALVGVAYFVRHAWALRRVADDLKRNLRASEAETHRWRGEAQQALEGLGAAIDREFTKWSLTDAERNVALLLLRGMSHKEIAHQRGTGEGTVRQQSLAIYRKAGLSGRSSLAAFFLEGLVLPDRSTATGR